MKLLSEFIKDLQTLKEEYGDLPVETSDYNCEETIPDDDAHAVFREEFVHDSVERKFRDCILIV